MSLLFQPIKIRSVLARNRIVVSPMCQYSSTDGFANDWHLVHLGTRAVGGAGIVFTEATAVMPEGRISPGDLGIWKEAHVSGLKRVSQVIKSNGAVPGIQLAHAGRKASRTSPWKGNRFLTAEAGGWQTLAPSPLAYREGDPVPQALTRTEIGQVVQAFSDASVRAFEAGFEIIEIHAAHGYLLHEFLSPLSNQRNDEYGGAFENRIRLLLEVVQAVRTAIPNELPLFVRISATDWVAGGWDEADAIQLAKNLKELGVDLIDCSAGGNSPNQQIVSGPLYQVPYAANIKSTAGILTGAVGMITDALHAETILHEGKADLIFMGRQLLRDPYFPLHAAKRLGENIPWPVQYERAKI